MSHRIRDVSLICVGSFLFALSFNLFFDPFFISPGGVAGLAMIFSHFTGLGVGVYIIMMNIPLVVLTYMKMGKGIILSSAVTIALFSLMIDLTAGLTSPVEDKLLAALCGGVLIGVGLGFIFRGGATTGGTAIASKLLLYYHPHLRLGKIILALDGLVVGITAFVFRDFSLAVYAFIALYLASRIMDAVLYGFDYATLTYVISDKHAEIGEAIKERLERGVTYLEAAGGYRGNHTRVVLCAVKRGQLSALRKILEELDPQAFLIVTEGHQIFGSGFLSGKG